MAKAALMIAVLVPIIFLYGQNQNTQNMEAMKLAQWRRIELRKIELEEKRLYLASFQGSRITEAKAREVSEWILRNLKDYPQGKKAKHADEDSRLIAETVAALLKSN